MKPRFPKLLNRLFPEILYHILFWVFIIIFYTWLFSGKSGAWRNAFIYTLVLLPVYMTASYYVSYRLIPDFLFLKKFRHFIIRLVYLIFILFILQSIILLVVMTIPLSHKGTSLLAVSPFSGMSMVLSTYFVVIFAALIRIIRRRISERESILLLEKARIEAELKFLRTQLQPHFLFNTLNNLYALTMKKSDAAPEMVLGLSRILDRLLQSRDDKEKPLTDELDLLQDYATLEKLRYGDRLELSIYVTGHPERFTVAPFLILPLLENAFKYSMNGLEKGWITCSISAEITALTICLRNSVGDKSALSGTGIGLENLARRLEYQYPGRHELITSRQNDFFEASLKIIPEQNHEQTPLSYH